MGGENWRGGGKEQSKSVQEHYIIPDLIRAFLSPTTPHPLLCCSCELSRISCMLVCFLTWSEVCDCLRPMFLYQTSEVEGRKCLKEKKKRQSSLNPQSLSNLMGTLATVQSKVIYAHQSLLRHATSNAPPYWNSVWFLSCAWFKRLVMLWSAFKSDNRNIIV